MSTAVKKCSPAPEARCAAGIEYQLVRRSIQQMHLHVHRTGEVSVSAPLRARAAQADRFVAQNTDWIAHAKKARAAQAEAESAPLPDKAEALMQMQAICEGLFPLFADSVPHGKPLGRVQSQAAAHHLCAAFGAKALGRTGICGRARALPFACAQPQPAVLGRGGKAYAGLEGPPCPAAQ